MDEFVVSRLIDLNHLFYQTFAADFAATRQRLQPGVAGLLDRLVAHRSLLDIGCGSGELARQLGQAGFGGQYTGLDFSSKLLDHARQQVRPGASGVFTFIPADLADAGWRAPLGSARWDAALAFAVLHHLPGHALHLQTLEYIHSLLKPGGLFYFSVWQFQNSPKLSARVVAWQEAGLNESQVDPGDSLLDWRAGGRGLRYVHSFTQAELERLAADSGFDVEETFYSDGKQGRLGLYQVWKKPV